jgi:hypothetical protein
MRKVFHVVYSESFQRNFSTFDINIKTGSHDCLCMHLPTLGYEKAKFTYVTVLLHGVILQGIIFP